jgi:Predicted periplasmic protein (DUF2092)
MPFDYGFRLNNRQRIANAKPIEADKNQSIDGAEGLFLRSGSPQNVYLLPQRQNFRLERYPRPKQIYDHPNNEPDKISHPATASPDSRSTASQIEFATGTTVDQLVNDLQEKFKRPMPAADLLLTNSYDDLTSDVTDIKDLGSGVIGGVECDYLAFRKKEVDFQVWIAQGSKPYPSLQHHLTDRARRPAIQHSASRLEDGR